MSNWVGPIENRCPGTFTKLVLVHKSLYQYARSCKFASRRENEERGMIYRVYTFQRHTLETANEDALEQVKAYLPQDDMLATKNFTAPSHQLRRVHWS